MSENRWPLLLGAAALVWANLPYLVGYAVQDDYHLFSGFFIFEQDGFSYLAKMRQGSQGEWLFRLPFTTEPHQGGFLYVFYLLTGKMARALDLSLITGYHLIRLLGSLAILGAGIRFISFFADSRRWRMASWILVLAGIGPGWLISTFRPEFVAYVSIAPDAFLFTILHGPPHVTVAAALLLWLIPEILSLFEQARRSEAKRSLFCSVLLGTGGLVIMLVAPPYGVTLLAVIGGYWLICQLTRRAWVPDLVTVGTMCLPSLLYVAYYVRLLHNDPVIAAWATGYPSTTIPWLALSIDGGLLYLLAVFGVVTARWWYDQRRLLLLLWIALLPFLFCLPISFNLRLVGGAQFAMAVAAGYWIDRQLLPWVTINHKRRVVAVLLLAVTAVISASHPLLFGVGASAFVSTRPPSLFFSPDEVAALRWMAEQGDRSVVLAAESTGNRIPAFSSVIPVLGHPFETLAVEKKRADVSCFFAASTNTAERSAILDEYGVNLIWWGEAERKQGDFSPYNEPGIEQVFDSASIEIWRRK